MGPGEPLGTVFDDGRRVAGRFQAAPHERGDARFVFDDEDQGHDEASLWSTSPARTGAGSSEVGDGRWIVKVAPPPDVSVTTHRPPWPFAIASTIARPSPEPPTARDPWARSKRRKMR